MPASTSIFPFTRPSPTGCRGTRLRRRRGHARRVGAASGKRNRRRALRRLAGWSRLDRSPCYRAQGDRRHECAGAYMLAHLGAPALVALEDRSAGQLAVLHPDTLVATRAASRRSPPWRLKAPGARRTTFSSSPPVSGSARPGCRARREPSSASTIANCSAIPRSCAPLLKMPDEPAPGCFAASTRCHRSAPRRSSTMPPGSPLPGGRPACRSSMWSLAAFRAPRFET